MDKSRFTSIRWIDKRQKEVIVDICGDIINRNPTKKELKDLKKELPRKDIVKREEYLLEFLIHFNDKEGRPPTTRDFAKNPNYPNPYPYTLLFGSWDRAIEKAGLLNKRVRARSEKYTDEELLESLRRFEMEERRPPIEIDLINNPNYPGLTTFQRHFGSLERSKKLVRQDIDSMIIKGSLETNKQKARLAEIIVRDHLAGNTTDLSGKNCNSPYDGICPNNHIYDVKSSKLYDGIYFNFDLRNTYREDIEWYYLLGFNEDYSKLKYVWRVLSFDFADVDNIYIGTNSNYKYNVKNMKEYDITEKIKPIFKNWLDKIQKGI